MDERVEQAQIWFKRAEAENDIFIRFFLLWLSLNILYAIFKASGRLRNGEQETVEKYFSSLNKNWLHNNLQNKRAEWAFFLKRKKGYMIDDFTNFEGNVQNEKLKLLSGDLINFYQKGIFTDGLCKRIGTFLYKIRCNLFHGEKIWNKPEDEEVLKMANPILEDLLGRISSSSYI